RSEETLQRTEHRPVAAEDDGDVRAAEIGLRLADAVLLHLLVRQQQLDAGLPRDLLEPLERRADRRGLAVRDHRRPADGATRSPRRSWHRWRRAGAAAHSGRGAGTLPGCPSAPADPR